MQSFWWFRNLSFTASHTKFVYMIQLKSLNISLTI